MYVRWYPKSSFQLMGLSDNVWCVHKTYVLYDAAKHAFDHLDAVKKIESESTMSRHSCFQFLCWTHMSVMQCDEKPKLRSPNWQSMMLQTLSNYSCRYLFCKRPHFLIHCSGCGCTIEVTWVRCLSSQLLVLADYGDPTRHFTWPSWIHRFHILLTVIGSR